MLQRQSRQLMYHHNFQLKLQQSEQQLSADFYQLTQLQEEIRRKRISQSQCSNILQQMIQKMSHPVLGLQILKDKFEQMDLFQNTGFSSFETIQAKASSIYVQVIMADLKKIINEQPIQPYSSQEVKNMVQQINWKIGMEKSIHESRVQQVGQHVDLMKFFEGVRNYQNWNEKVKKQTIEKLKHKAHMVQIKLTLKKGFILSKIQKITKSYQQSFERLFIDKCKNIQKLNKITIFCQSVQKSGIKYALEKIYDSSVELKDSEKLRNLFDAHWSTRVVPNVHRQLMSFLKTTFRNKLFVSQLQKIFKTKTLSIYAKLLQKLNFKRKIKAGNVLLGLEKINNFNDQKLKSLGIRALNLPLFRVFKLLNKSAIFVIRQAFDLINQQAQNNTKKPSQLSLRTKAKILSLLPTPESPSVDIRQKFLNWYIKGNETKFSKQIYNIWLTGTTNKFTFFMRLKNLINENRNYKIKYELKLFLMVFNEKMNKYYNTSQKSILHKWVTNARRIKKIEKALQMLSNVQKKTELINRKFAYGKLRLSYDHSIIKQKFCLKYMTKYVTNVRSLVNNWKMLPDVKKSKGQILMRNIFRKVIYQIQETKVQSFSPFKENKIVGRNKKVLRMRRAFNQDFIYLQKFFQMWRMKKNDLIKKQNDFQDKKAKTLLLLQRFHIIQYEKNIKDIIKKFSVKSTKQKIRTNQTKRIFMNILQKNKKQSMLKILLAFKNTWQEGKTKKNNLVRSLVEASKRKQTLSLYLIRNKAHQLQNLQKIRRTEDLFMISSERLRQSITIFDKSKYVYFYLCKIVANRSRNLHFALKNIQALPNRINWKKRDNAIKLYETLQYLYKRNKGYSFGKYRQELIAGRFKMTKSMDIMAAKYFDVTRNYFSIYRKNANTMKMNEVNKAISINFQHMNEVFQGNMKSFFIGQAEWKKKADHILKLNQRVRNRVGQTFKLWRQNTKAMKYYEGVLNEKKVRYIEILLKAVGKNQLSETKKSIGMFKKNAHISEIQLTFLKRLCQTQAGKVVKAMMIWKGLPEQKNKEKIAKATKFESLMAKIGIRNFKKSFLAFKDGQYYGNQKKKYCIRQLVAKSNSGIKSYFQKWRGNSKLSIIFGQCEGVSHLIHIGQSLAEVNFRILFEGNEAQEKRQKLHKLDLILCQQKRELINLWRQKIIGLRNFEKKKKSLLSKLILIQQNTEKRNVRDFVIKKYAQQRVVTLMQRQKYKQSKLLQIVDRAMKRRKQNATESFECFRFNMYKGNFKKQRAFENWLKDKVAHISGIIGGWNDLSRQAVLGDQRKLIGHNFEQMDSIVRANFTHLLASRKEMQLKKKTLNNLFRTQQLRLKGYLNLWHNRVKQLKILSEMDKQAKTSILQRINKIVSIGSDQNVKKAIQKFHNSMKIEMIQKKFINQLLKTKSGLVLEAIGKWKSIPAINLGQRYKKGQKFFNKLESIHKSHVKFVYSSFKKQYEEANMLKKQSILQLFEMTSTGIRRYYRRWQKLTKQKHTLSSVTQLMKSLDIMNDCLSNQYMIIFQDQRAYKVKINAINKLILAAQGTTQNYFSKWRDNARQLKIQQSMDVSKKTLALQIFTKAIEGSETNSVINAINKFRMNSIVTDVSKKFFNRLLQTKTGKVVQFYQKLKTIPDTKVAVKKKKAIKFEASLNKFAMRIIRSTFNPFKNCNYVAIDRKKYCLSKLVRNSMGQQLKSFTRWRNVTHEGKVLTHSQIGEKCFSNMQNLLLNTFAPMFTDYKQQIEKKKGLCRKLVMNSQFVQHHAFMIWKEAQKEDDLKIVKKESKTRDVLKNLINVFNGHERKSAVSGFGQFRNVLLLDKLRTFSTRQKNIHTKAYKFYESMQKIKNNRLSLLIQAGKNSAVQMNFANKITSLEQMFKNSHQIYADNLMMLMRSERQTVIIENALDRIFRNFKVGTQKAFSLWRQNAKVLKLEKQMGNEKKKTILDVINKLLNNNEVLGVKKTIQSFRQNAKQAQIQKDILMKILNCKAGKVPILFMKWKALPSQTGKKYKMKAMKFQITLFRAWSQRMKFVYQSFKNQSYDATVKKQYAIRKLVAVTQSDSNRVFNKWRKVNNETKITEKMINMDRVLSSAQQLFIKNIFIFNSFKQENTAKINALNTIFLTQEIHLKDSLSRWIEQNKNYKITKITQALSKYTDDELRKRFLKECFVRLRHSFELQTMKGYINSLWKWKMTNTENQYYEKFIKVFSQSQELLNLSKLLNKKQCDTLHCSFTKIKIRGKERFDRKVNLVEKFMLKKAKFYFEKMRVNTSREKMSMIMDMYSQVVKTHHLTNIIAKITRRQQNDIFNTLKGNETYLQKVQKCINIIEIFKTKNLEQSFKSIYKYGFYKIITISLDARRKVQKHFYLDAFYSIAESAQLRHFDKKISSVVKQISLRKTFQTLRKNSERLFKQRLALFLLSGETSKRLHQSKVKAIQSFQKRRIKYICLSKISQILTNKLQFLQKAFFQIDHNDVKIISLLQKFKRGTAIKNILQKQDKKLLKGYFQKLKKKENRWIGESIRKFATRSSLRSSVAVSLWRLKTYAEL